jgi:putative PIN family toxin of toxin-antitoxin system
VNIVIDTNIFYSSFFGGNPRRIIDWWHQGQVRLCLSRAIIDEYYAVLERSGLTTGAELKDLLALFARGSNCLFTARPPQLHVVAADSDDNKFFECAVALQAKYIVSGDKHLLAVGDYMKITVCNPAEFVRVMTAES